MTSCGGPAPPTSERPIDATTAWYHRTRVLDVTGDGRGETLDLQARGPSSDSSVVTFRVIVDGAVAFTETWSSEYELVDPPPEAATAAGRDSLVRAALDGTLARVRVNPVDTTNWTGPWTAKGDDCMGDPRDCLAVAFRQRGAALDTAAVLRIAGEMRRPGAVQFTLSYGYETTMHLVWSPSARQVFVIHSCC